MSEPFISIASYRVKPGFADVVHQRTEDLVTRVEEREPQLLSFHFYLDEDRARLVCVQVHPNADSMATHMAVVADHIASASDWLELSDSTQLVLGVPPAVLDQYWQDTDKGPDRYPTFLAGFARSAPQASLTG